MVFQEISNLFIFDYIFLNTAVLLRPFRFIVLMGVFCLLKSSGLNRVFLVLLVIYNLLLGKLKSHLALHL